MELSARWGEGTGERGMKIFPRWNCELTYSVAGISMEIWPTLHILDFMECFWLILYSWSHIVLF